MKKLTPIQASARGERCTFNLMCCNYNPETTVLCHDTRFIDSNSPRKCDARAAYGCSNCHDAMDGRTEIKWGSRHMKRYTWATAIMKTHVRLMQKGLLTFEGVVTEQKILPRKQCRMDSEMIDYYENAQPTAHRASCSGCEHESKVYRAATY